MQAEHLESLLLPWRTNQTFLSLELHAKVERRSMENGEAATGGSCANVVSTRHEQQVHDDYRNYAVAVRCNHLGHSLMIYLTTCPLIRGDGEPTAATRQSLRKVDQTRVGHGFAFTAISEATSLDERLEKT